ncbi:MAG: (Fe-S)-binding protein [Promethearchaeota archaeon]
MNKLENLKKEWQAIFSCMGCGDCGYATRRIVGRNLTCPVKEAKGNEGIDFEIYFARGRMNVLKSVLEGKLPLSRELAEFVYQCTECGNCTEVCHETHNEHIVLNTSKWIDHVKVWEALRKDLVEDGFGPLDRHKNLIDYMKRDDMRNPYGENKDKKLEWISEFPKIKERGDLVFFAGCTMPLRQKNTLKNMMKILNASGTEFAVSRKEFCCGSISLRVGDEKSYNAMMKHNIEEFKKMGAKTVFTACAGCYRTLKKDYAESLESLGEELPFEVKHITEILDELLNKGKIPFNSKNVEPFTVTYHDPCHLGRHMDLYEIPRQVIKKVPGVELKEMERNRRHAWCCGAGGGVKSQFPDLALEISKERINEAIKSGAQVLTTSCPFCIGNFNDVYSEMEEDIRKKIKPIDLIDLIASKL